MTETNQMTVANLAERALFAGGDWRAKMDATDALALATEDTSALTEAAAGQLVACDGDFAHAVRCAIKDRMEVVADWYETTGFEVSFADVSR